MQLYLIRHAESANNARPPYEREEDPGITAVGRLQAEYLGNWLKTLAIDYLITSPFRRTLETTRMASSSLDVPVQVWHDVFERGGCFRGHGPDATEGGPGLGRSDVVRFLTDDPSQCVIDDSISDSGWWFGKKRETDDEAVSRVTQVIGRLEETFGPSGETVVAIIHADLKRELLTQTLCESANAKEFGPMRNVGISKLDFDGRQWKLDWLNSVTHLPAKLITGNEM